MVYWIIIGAAAGFIATRILKLEIGVIQTIALGIVGAFVGGLILRALLVVMGAFAGFAGAIIGALLVIYLFRKIFESR